MLTPSPNPFEDPRRLRMQRLQRAASRVCQLILREDYPEVDIEIAKEHVRELARELYPDRMHLYEMIYESRFRRLWSQWRAPLVEEGPSWHDGSDW
jgi:hypothetical protein